MINEYICYKCKCEKCSKDWVTKTHEVPKVCPKCHSVKWNEGCAPAPETAQISQPVQPVIREPENDLAAFIAKARALKGLPEVAIEAEIAEPVDQWIGWTEEQQTYDDQTGEMRTYRRHIKTGRTKWIDTETYFG